MNFFVLVAGFLMAQTLVYSKVLDGVKAVVQERPILISDVSDRVQRVRGSESLAKILGVQQKGFDESKALDQLIEEKIILSAAQDMGSEPSESEINKQIAAIAAQNKISVEALQKSLSTEKINFDFYKQNIAVQLSKRAIIEKELRSSSTSVSDEELKSHFDQASNEEFHLFAIRRSSGKQGLNDLNKLKSSLSKANASALSKLLEENDALDLSWNDLGSLNPSFQRAIKEAGKNATITSAFSWNKASYLLVIKGRRTGSSEKFEEYKDQLRQQLQAKDIEERFKVWVEQKKKTLNVVVN